MSTIEQAIKRIDDKFRGQLNQAFIDISQEWTIIRETPGLNRNEQHIKLSLLIGTNYPIVGIYEQAFLAALVMAA